MHWCGSQHIFQNLEDFSRFKHCIYILNLHGKKMILSVKQMYDSPHLLGIPRILLACLFDGLSWEQWLPYLLYQSENKGKKDRVCYYFKDQIMTHWYNKKNRFHEISIMVLRYM